MGTKTTINKVVRQDIATAINRKLGKTLSKNIILDAIDIICESLTEKLSDGEQIYIDNFGLLDNYRMHSHVGVNIRSGKEQITSEVNLVQFIPDSNFKYIINQKRNFFTEQENGKKQR